MAKRNRSSRPFVDDPILYQSGAHLHQKWIETQAMADIKSLLEAEDNIRKTYKDFEERRALNILGENEFYSYDEAMTEYRDERDYYQLCVDETFEKILL